MGFPLLARRRAGYWASSALLSRLAPKDTMVSTDGPLEASVEVTPCVGSGSIPEFFDDVTQGTHFSACSVCGKVVPGGHVVEDH
jgi:hypothetical protein